MVLAPNDLFSWNNKYNKYNEYNITDIFTCFFLAMYTTYSLHAGILKPWRGRLPCLPVVFSSYHVVSLPLSRLNWRSLFPPWGSGPPFPKMAPSFTGSAHTPSPGSGTRIIWHCKQKLHILRNLARSVILLYIENFCTVQGKNLLCTIPSRHGRFIIDSISHHIWVGWFSLYFFY